MEDPSKWYGRFKSILAIVTNSGEVKLVSSQFSQALNII